MEKKVIFYYDLHVFYARNDGFGVPIKSEKELTEEEAIELAVSLGKIDSEDAKSVDYVDAINFDEYSNMGGE